MVFLETGFEKDTGKSESSSARRERGGCRWRRGADKVMVEVERESRKAQTEKHESCHCQVHLKETTSGEVSGASQAGTGRHVLLSF